jgi:hypothetical protein
MERSKLEIAFRDLGEPVVLTTRMPITWEDDAQCEYEVFVKGHIDMGPFANLMERVEYIGKATGRRALLGNGEIVYSY